MFKVLAAAAAMLGFIHVDGKITAHFNNRPKNTPQARLVKAVHDAEVRWYEKPDDTQTEAGFKELVVPDSVKEIQVSGAVVYAHTTGSQLKEDGKHKVKIVSVKLEGESAVVQTRETCLLEWTDGRRWEQTNKLHTYRLQRIDGKWRIHSDEFD